jgi:hypothetical protein
VKTRFPTLPARGQTAPTGRADAARAWADVACVRADVACVRADVVRGRADVVRARADSARVRADAANARAEAARDRAECARGRADAVRERASVTSPGQGRPTVFRAGAPSREYTLIVAGRRSTGVPRRPACSFARSRRDAAKRDLPQGQGKPKRRSARQGFDTSVVSFMNAASTTFQGADFVRLRGLGHCA